MDLLANRPRVAWNKFWCQFLKCALRCEPHLLSISAAHSHFLAIFNTLCVPT